MSLDICFSQRNDPVYFQRTWQRIYVVRISWNCAYYIDDEVTHIYLFIYCGNACITSMRLPKVAPVDNIYLYLYSIYIYIICAFFVLFIYCSARISIRLPKAAPIGDFIILCLAVLHKGCQSIVEELVYALQQPCHSSVFTLQASPVMYPKKKGTDHDRYMIYVNCVECENTSACSLPVAMSRDRSRSPCRVPVPHTSELSLPDLENLSKEVKEEYLKGTLEALALLGIELIERTLESRLRRGKSSSSLEPGPTKSTDRTGEPVNDAVESQEDDGVKTD